MTSRTLGPEVVIPAPKRRSPVSGMVRFVVWLLLGSLVLGFLIGPRRMVCRLSREEVAKLEVMRYVDDAYVLWSRQHPGAGAYCPTLMELNEWTNKRDTLDPWGSPYHGTCNPDATSIRVVSAGPDQCFGTTDDITSDR